jgi:hypothetical protein
VVVPQRGPKRIFRKDTGIATDSTVYRPVVTGVTDGTSIWSGRTQIFLVSFDVQLYVATEAKSLISAPLAYIDFPF